MIKYTIVVVDTDGRSHPYLLRAWNFENAMARLASALRVDDIKLRSMRLVVESESFQV
jgi:hypothetical protein